MRKHAEWPFAALKSLFKRVADGKQVQLMKNRGIAVEEHTVAWGLFALKSVLLGNQMSSKLEFGPEDLPTMAKYLRGLRNLIERLPPVE